MINGIERKLQDGIANKGIVGYLVNTANRKNPFEDASAKFRYARSNFFAGILGVYDSFEYEGREINPVGSVEQFLEDGIKLYDMGVEASFEMMAAAIESGSLTKLKKVKGDPWTSNFRKMLKSEIKLAGDIAVWLSRISDRGWGVGSSVKLGLKGYGIEYPEKLPQDVEVMGKKILKLYNALC